MLDLDMPTDIIFARLLDDTFTFSVDMTIGFHLDNPDTEQWKEELRHASRIFSPQSAVAMARDLRKANKDESGLWELNDYHYCLIYDLLEDYCTYKNETAKGDGKAIIEISDIEIWEIDFDLLVGCYFPDEDFLITPEVMGEISEETKVKFNLRKETFGVAMGLTPHPDEVKFKLLKKGKFVPALNRRMYSKGSRKYPS